MDNLITKPPKGTIDLYNEEYTHIKYYINQLEELFKKYNGIGLETPVFEHRDNLLNKYGDEAENKLVFNLESGITDSNFESLTEKYTLRYDLTVPKTRFIKSKLIEKARIYSIGKVYRRDNPSVGRFREFYQADFDIVGEDSSSLINELQLLKMAVEFIEKNKLGPYKILINSTEVLKDMLLSKIKISQDKFKLICSTIDKLDKYTFDQLVGEFEAKGMEWKQIQMLKSELAKDIPNEQINRVISMANIYGFGSNIKFTPSLARGLDYYNGIIFEIVLENFALTVISGGRYDGLIEGTSLIGISFGLSRMASILPKLELQTQWKNIYMCASIDKSISLETKLSIVASLEKKFNTNIIIDSVTSDKKLTKNITWCIYNNIKYLFVIGSRELENNKVILKNLEAQTQELIDLN